MRIGVERHHLVTHERVSQVREQIMILSVRAEATSLHKASESGNLAVVQTLLEHGAAVVATIISAATARGHYAVCMILLPPCARTCALASNVG